MRRLALASIITAAALLATGCSTQERPEEPSVAPSTPASSAPVPSPTGESAAAELTKTQLVELCVIAPGVAQDVLYASPEEGRFERRNDGLWFVELSGLNSTSATAYTSCIIDNDSREVLSSQSALESEADPNNVYAYDSAVGGE